MELLQQVHRNEVVLTGTALDAPVYSHCNHEARFYQFPMEILRLSGQTDELVVMAPAPLLERAAVARGARVSLSGQLRSYNNKTGQGRRLILTVFAKTLRPGEGEDHNVIFLTGSYLQTACLPQHAAGAEHLRCDAGGKPSLRTFGLYSLYCMGRAGG